MSLLTDSEPLNNLIINDPKVNDPISNYHRYGIPIDYTALELELDDVDLNKLREISYTHIFDETTVKYFYFNHFDIFMKYIIGKLCLYCALIEIYDILADFIHKTTRTNILQLTKIDGWMHYNSNITPNHINLLFDHKVFVSHCDNDFILFVNSVILLPETVGWCIGMGTPIKVFDSIYGIDKYFDTFHKNITNDDEILYLFKLYLNTSSWSSCSKILDKYGTIVADNIQYICDKNVGKFMDLVRDIPFNNFINAYIIIGNNITKLADFIRLNGIEDVTAYHILYSYNKNRQSFNFL